MHKKFSPVFTILPDQQAKRIFSAAKACKNPTLPLNFRLFFRRGQMIR